MRDKNTKTRTKTFFSRLLFEIIFYLSKPTINPNSLWRKAQFDNSAQNCVFA